MAKPSVKEKIKLQEQSNSRRRAFLRAVAQYLVENQAGKSIALSMPDGVIPWAKEWAYVRGRSPLFGYPTIEEAEQQLCEMFGVTCFDPPNAKKQ